MCKVEYVNLKKVWQAAPKDNSEDDTKVTPEAMVAPQSCQPRFPQSPPPPPEATPNPPEVDLRKLVPASPEATW